MVRQTFFGWLLPLKAAFFIAGLALPMIALDVQAQQQKPAALEGRQRTEILDAARNPVERDLGKTAKFVVKSLGSQQDWAFLHARMVTPEGKQFSYVGTPFADAAEHGLKSDSYAALLHLSAGRWQVIAYSIGPTDVAWQNWSRQYGAPMALFPGPAE